MVGREEETKILQSAFESGTAQMIAIYGRRRIGKTYLVKEFYKTKEAKLLTITGQYDADMKTQINNAKRVLKDELGTDASAISSWEEVFSAIKNYHTQNSSQHFVLFIDELPWIATPKSGFLGALGYIWNTYFSSYPNVTFVLCGSAASWMIKNIASSKGELHQRITKKIALKPFTLKECGEYLKSRGFEIPKKSVIDYYITIGGVAQYLSYLNPTKSYSQNINELLFDENGSLYNEFNQIFVSLFGANGFHKKIVELLGASKTLKMSASEIAQALKIPTLATVYVTLDELAISGFLGEHNFYNQTKRDRLYSLSDPYSFFYFKWIKSLNKSDFLQNRNYWQNMSMTQDFRSWSGSAFEMAAHNHIPEIKKALGISGVNTQTYYWSQKGDKKTKGAQIDLLIKRADKTVTIVECKYYDSEFVITEEYEKNLRNKIARFSESDKEKNGITLALLTIYGAKNGKNVDIAYSNLTGDIFW